ncbi:MAG: iron dependent repressor, metal binding and dimerization domain protein [Sulfolobales archaeon]
MADNLTPELVDYLLAILYLTTKRGKRCCIKLIEVSKILGVAKPTTSLMLRKLLRMGLITKSSEGIAISELGLEVSKAITKKHEVLEDMLIQHGLDHDRACEVARVLELIVDDADITKIARTLKSSQSVCDKLQCRLDSAVRSRKGR